MTSLVSAIAVTASTGSISLLSIVELCFNNHDNDNFKALKPISNVLLLHSAIILDVVVLISKECAYSKLLPNGI